MKSAGYYLDIVRYAVVKKTQKKLQPTPYQLSCTNQSINKEVLEGCLGASLYLEKELVSRTPKERQATVCFYIMHARFRHAPGDVFDTDFICQIIFHRRCFDAKRIFLAKSGDKRTIQTFVEVLSIFSQCSKFKAFLRFVKAASGDWTSSKLKKKRTQSTIEEECQRCTAQCQCIMKRLSTS